VLVQALLRRLVVVGRDDEDGVRAEPDCAARLLDGVRGVVAPRPRDDVRATLADFDGGGDDRLALIIRHGHALARCPARHE
jgi:hypothetical protein